ncbi:MAG: phosphotransferase [Desulfobulbaceae bacterium]|nr:phosphotransferase [Desulfobulbaceae bacterium]
MFCRGLEENFNFLILEVSNQVDAVRDFLGSGDKKILQNIICKDDYIDNLKTILEKWCFDILTEAGKITKKETDSIHAIHTITVNLERIGDFCVNIAKQVGYLSDVAFVHKYNYQGLISEVQQVLPKIVPAFKEHDLATSLSICRSEHQIDNLYKESFCKIMEELRDGKNIENLITVLFIFRYLERIGDSLLNIGEALLLSILGEKIKIDQFQALEESLNISGYRGTLSDLDFSSILGSRSGCRIRKLQHEQNDKFLSQATSSIFKEGNRNKIWAEKKNIEIWSEIFPGLVPKIFSYQESEETSSLLLEFIPCCTYEEIILSSDLEELHTACTRLQATVKEIWDYTLQEGSRKVDYVEQILSRLDSILQVHPSFYRMEQNIGKSRIESTETILEKCLLIEDELKAPFTVFIHGDFNVNNIFYNGIKERIHFIDLYRSKNADYVQDVSVFIISNFRQPAFKVQLRDRLNWTTKKMYEMACRFAEEKEDTTFEARMALALARSFYTSTRFELNTKFAHEMYMRAHFLLEKILAHEGTEWQKFKLPTGIMYY